MVVALSSLAGLLVGSFLNVVAHRVPARRSIVTPASSCPHCDEPIRMRDNLPVVSWLALRGRCRDCGHPISWRYPAVEVATAALFGAIAALLGPVGALPAYLWFVALTFVLALIDVDTKLIPNRVLYPGGLVAAVLLAGGAVVDGEPAAFVRGLLAGGAYFAGTLVLAFVSRGGFGLGDVKLAALLGLFTGYRGWGILAVAVFTAFFLGGVVSLGLLATGRRGRKDAIPFGPFLVTGALVAIAFGRAIVTWYVG